MKLLPNWRSCAARLASHWERERQWGAELQRLREELAPLARQTEHDFLEVGRQLQQAQAAARRVSDHASGAVSTFSSGRGGEASGVLEQIIQFAAGATEDSGIVRVVIECEDKVRKLQPAVRGLQSGATVFQVLGMLTSIESAGRGYELAGFESVAIDIRKMAASIRERCAWISDTSGELLEALKTSALRVATLERQRRDNLPTVRRRCEEGLRLLSNREAAATETAAAVSGRYTDVLASIEDLVTSLQFHDITRQQIEHVLLVTADAERRLSSPDGTSRAAVSAMLRLQGAQLRQSARTLHGSLATITKNLKAIAANLEAAGTQLEGHLSGGGRTDEAQVEDLLSGFSEIQGYVEKQRECDTELRETAEGIRGRVGNLSATIGQIDDIGIQMRRVALNSAIKAAQLRQDGEVMETLAAQVQRLTEDTAGQTEIMRKVMDALTNATCQWACGDTADYQVVEKLPRCLGEIRRAHAESQRLLGSTLAETASLGERLQSLAESIDSHEAAVARLENGAARLTEMADELAAVSGGALSEEDQGVLEQVHSRYTMQSEREVESAALGAEPATEVTVMNDEEMAGNVEFF